MVQSHSTLTAIFFYTLLSLTISGCSNEPSSQSTTQRSTSPVTVETATVQLTDKLSQVEVMGTLQAVDQAVVSARVSGHIIDIDVVLGSQVQKGDLLARINAGEISAQLLQATARLNEAERNLAREKKLLQKNAGTLDKVKSSENEYRIAQALYQEAEVMLSYTSITAPFDGTVTKKNANIGDLATPGKAILQLENRSALQVQADISESLILHLQQGDSLPVYIPAANRAVTGTLAEIATAADPLSHTTPIKIDIPVTEDLRTGQFARITLPHKTSSSIFIPAQAVTAHGQMQRVFIAQDKTAHMRLVRTGRSLDGQIEILAGLQPGDMLILPGKTTIQDNQPVTVH